MRRLSRGHAACTARRSDPAATPFPISRRCWPRRRRCAAATCSPASRQHRAKSAWRRNTRSPTCRCATFLAEQVVPYESDEVTRLIVDSHDRAAFAADRPSHGRRTARLAAVGRIDHGRARRARARDHAGDGGGGQQDQPAAGSHGDGGANARWSRASATPSGCPAGCRCGCSPIIRPTISPALPPAFSMAFCSAPAMPSSASIPPPTARSGRTRCSRCSRSCGSSSTCRPRAACWRT